MKWPWSGHEQCQAYLVRLRGEVCGRICRVHDELEYHLLVEPGEAPSRGTMQVDSIPVGSA